MARDVCIVPHTHWDREWYAAFQTFRMKLVDLLDDLLDLLEADPGYAHFMLDGQMAVVDDYLAIRPENEQRLRALAVSGRLGMGPWHILMDEFLVSGETMIRNLQLGLRKAGEFGGATEVGYLPDMFGHIAQMPQLLTQFGLEHAVVWRGVPSVVDKSAFTWVAPDGSSVRAEYLLEGYGNGASLPDDAKDLLDLVQHFETQHESMLVGPILWMNGTDHLMPQPWLGRVVAEANAISDRYRVRVSSLGEYLMSAPTEGIARWQGELRSGARANLLMGVTSNRTDVRQAAAAAERQIERIAEPLSALFLAPDRWPAAFLDAAWLEVIRNSAHDSSCACSIDEVVDAVLVRYYEARQIADGLTDRAIKAVAASLADVGPVAVNASARTRGGLIEVRLPGHDPVDGTQVLRLAGGDMVADGVTRADAATLVQAALDNMPELHDAEVGIDEDGVLDIRLSYDPANRGDRYSGPAKAQVAQAAAEKPDGPARLAINTPTYQKVLAYVDAVPGFGWRRWNFELAEVAHVEVINGVGDSQPTTITNGLVTVGIDPSTGIFSLDGVNGFGNLVDDGDVGDTYNYCAPADDRVIAAPDSVTVRVIERGPLRARVAIDRTYTWPERAAGQSRTGSVSVDTTTIVEVVAGSDAVRVTTELDNTARDHRLRVWFPLPRPATGSAAECAFAIVERGLFAEGGPTEKPMATYPSRRFVIAGGLTVLHDGLLEYELVDIDDGAGNGNGNDGKTDDARAHALALTMLRCTGLISQGPMASRPLPAGPVTAAPGAQMPGHQKLRYAVRLGDSTTEAYAAAADVFEPLLVTRAMGGGTAPDQGTALEVEGAQVSAVVREAGQLTVRVFNPSPDKTTVRIAGRTGWLVDLRGRPLEHFDETFVLGPWKIATAVLSENATAAPTQRQHGDVVDTLLG